MLQYFSRLNKAEQQSVLHLIKTFINSRSSEFPPATLAEYNRELEEADEQIEQGNYVTLEEVKKRFIK